ncbi:uncharacterized protein TNCV_5010501 [Trichonephila clavipes]|nr:uncharacterized protein TNCV_5010501 [Trichonephila clavipes]
MESNRDFECLLVGENSILLVCAAKVRLLKLQDADHERDADQPNLTRVQWATYPTNNQAEEKVACVGLNRSLEQSLQHVGVHYPAKRYLQGCLEGRERLQAVEHFTDVPVAIEITLNSLQIGSSMIRNRSPNHNSRCQATMSFDNALWKAAFTGIASNTNAAIIIPQIEA